MVLKDKNVLVVGLAKSGIPTVNTLLKLGANVTINDLKTKEELQEVLAQLDVEKLAFILGCHPEEVSRFDLLVLSPGVPTDLPFIQQAKDKGLCVIGELELAYRLCKGSFIAITGTNGKTTTTALTGEIFRNSNRETYVVGNIGVAAISKVLEAGGNASMITEVSSFQLESIEQFRPHIAAILNITPDHLNRHKTMDNYIKAKARIFMNQDKGDYVILNADNEITNCLAREAKSQVILFSRKEKLGRGVFVFDDHIVVKVEDGEEPITICHVDELRIPGQHNLENALAATAIAYWAGIPKNVITATLKEFMGVEHRIEFVDEIEGVRFINDSKGTNPDASIKAVEAMKSSIILIAGGMDKGSQFDEFVGSFDHKVKHMLVFGETADKLKEAGQNNGFYEITKVNNLDEAVMVAYQMAEKGDVVLLSPACASWDMYPSYEHRGHHFKDCVKQLRRSKE